MKVGVVGSCYGELDRVYDAVRKLTKQGITIDLLICCGDFMAVRDEKDLEHVVAPANHKEDLKDFPKYFSGRSEVPVTTVFIGGKNEASNLLREHYYGGWVAPGIYYLGAAGVLRVGPLRIAGISGSFHSGDYFRGRHESPPYTEDFKRSAFHAREWDAARLEKLQEPVDVVISYDWPRGIWKHGPYQKMVEQQDLGENLKREMEGGTLGSPAAMELMKKLRPPFWFSASVQVRFPALVAHGDGTFTRFLGLERCRGGKEFLQVLDIDPRVSSAMRSLPKPQWQRNPPVPATVPLCYDAEWMAMQKANHENISFTWHPSKSRVTAPSKEDFAWVKERLKLTCGQRPRPPGSRHPNLTPTKLRKSRGAGRQTFQNFSTLQLRELFEIRGMDFPGHLDKASMIQHLEDFDALHGCEDILKDHEESYPIPCGFIAAPCAQRGKILEMLQLPDIWKDQEEHRRQLLRAAASGTIEVKYDPFSQPESEDPATKPGGQGDQAPTKDVDPGAVTGRSPSPSSSAEEDFNPPAKPGEATLADQQQSEEVPQPAESRQSDETPEPEQQTVPSAADGEEDAEELKKMLQMGLGTEEDAQLDPEDPAEVVDLEPPQELLEVPVADPIQEADHSALEEDLASLEAELAIAEELLMNPREPQDPEEPEEPEDRTSGPPVSASDPAVVELGEESKPAEQAAAAAQMLAEAMMGLADLEADAEDVGNAIEEDIDGGEAQLADSELLTGLAEVEPAHSQVEPTHSAEEMSGFAALALAVEEAEREEAEEMKSPRKVLRLPRKRKRF